MEDGLFISKGSETESVFCIQAVFVPIKENLLSEIADLEKNKRF